MSVFHPEGGMPRIIRYVPASKMPSSDTLTLYDKSHNVVTINKELFDKLDWFGKYRAERATTTLMFDHE